MLIIFILLLFFSISSASDPVSQALLTLKSSLITPPNVLSDWTIPQKPTPYPRIHACAWTGIQCTQNSTKLTHINLSFQNLTGVLPGTPFDHLTDLTDVNISHNSLSGPLPAQIFNLTKLTSLDISHNNFSGLFPLEHSNMNIHKLEVLDAFSNSFTGPLPPGVCENANASLKVLNFAGSYFTGPVPAAYGLCENLKFLHLAGNLLTGNLPVELGYLKRLTHMELGYNMFQGSIPRQFGNMSELQYLDISDANISGLIPKELGELTKLETLFLFKNSLSGLIPGEIGNISSLLNLDLSDNMLTGPIPESFSKLKSLYLLSLMCNEMNGSVPEGIAKLPSLETLLIWDNLFSGKLPQELGKHSKLKLVDVSTNYFGGGIPPYICTRGKLGRLMLFSNYFSGGISAISNCSSLIRIRLEDNEFSGGISLDFKAVGDVSYVDLSYNRFTGGIPFDVILASNLEHFSVSNNPNLGGVLPEKTWALPALRNFSASSCNLSGKVPEFSLCESLSVIELNGNRLTGQIPESISRCKSLETLNLAENNLSGEIPVKFKSLMSLKFLNLSYNELSGSIPLLNTFKSIDSHSFLGNPSLCGELVARQCHHGNGIELGSRRNHKVAWVHVLCAVVVVLSCFLFVIVYYRRQYTRNWKMVSFGLPELTKAEVLKSFDSVERVESSYTSNPVCKAVLLTGMTVVVRKIEWGAKSSNLLLDFVTRMGSLRHKNLIRMLGFCYNKNLGYLLFEYLPNGNLDEKIGIKRDWSSKHRLVVNIAKGLCFLHHECYPAIPHGSLKTSNVAFDENMEPRLVESGFKIISAMETGEYKGLIEDDLKDDIYHFGEVVLEILINGKRKNGGISVHKIPKDVLLKELYDDNEVADTSSSKSVQEEIKLVLEVVLACTATKQSDRPSIEDVLKILSQLDPVKK
ncbi:uncharacterized protein LOC143549824 [Bidens hawaiensis]|uniref:uncharacterized protein LOC143549824 n=1 Tax=Bidens hawaiensis TaxID=980011 RepID=UPI004049D91E